MTMREYIKKNKDVLEEFQQAMFRSFGSLIYSYFLENMKRKNNGKILTPEIKEVKSFLNFGTPFIDKVCEKFIIEMFDDPLYSEYKELLLFHSFDIFNNRNCDGIAECLIDYIIPNMQRRIPEAISKKFEFEDTSKQTFFESNECEFKTDDVESMFWYVLHEFMLQYLYENPKYNDLRSINLIDPTNTEKVNFKSVITEGDVLSIENINALTPILFDKIICDNDVYETISFVTNTHIDFRRKIFVTNNTNIVNTIRFNKPIDPLRLFEGHQVINTD